MSDQRLQTLIYKLSVKSYIGSVLQCMRIYKNNSIPTAGVTYNKKLRAIVMYYNQEFLDKLSDTELMAVLTHEIEHVLRKHIYIYLKNKAKDHKRLNCAMDLVINQTIQGLPKQALQLEQFKDKNNKPFPQRESTEVYYDLLKDSKYQSPSGGEDEEPTTLDEHAWDDMTESEATEGMSDLVKRAQNQHEKTHSSKSRELEDALDGFNRIRTDIDYKRLLESTLRASIPSKDIKKTWTRPSRRYGLMAAGNTKKPLPSVKVYLDTSGSMSPKELNEALNIIYDIFKHGMRSMKVGLFHHHLYHSFVYSKGMKFDQLKLQSGGTDLQEVVEDISKNGEHINLIVTDGHYDRPTVPKLSSDVIFLINEYGNKEHPLSDIGKTITFKVKV